MNVERVGVLFALACTLLMSVRVHSQTKPLPRPEQTNFSAEDASVLDPVAIPDGIQALLLRDESVRQAMSTEKPALTEFPTAWFSASAVHLASGHETDFVIVGYGPLIGANITQFWVFRSTPNNFQEALTGRAHDLVIRKGTWNGLREIELLSATGIAVHTVLLRFDGARYTAYHDEWEPTE